jgi:hypothetical protein
VQSVQQVQQAQLVTLVPQVLQEQLVQTAQYLDQQVQLVVLEQQEALVHKVLV